MPETVSTPSAPGAPRSGGAPSLPFPSHLGPRLLRHVRAAVVLVFVAFTLTIVNLGFASSLPLRPFSRRFFSTYNRWWAGWWWSTVMAASRTYHGTDPVLTGDVLPRGENAIVVANHQEMPDIPFIASLAIRCGRGRDLTWFVKSALKYVPGLGWGMLFLDNVFLKREWARDAESIRRTFWCLTATGMPFWLVSFPEGTRITRSKHANSVEWAMRQGMEPLRHLLFPRPKGFQSTVAALRDHADAVYDITIGYPRGVPTLWAFMAGLSGPAHLHVRRFPIATLPVDPEALAEWLRIRFREKDDLLDRFYRTGSFA